MTQSESNQFPVVSMGKFTLLFVCTLGIYAVVWLYLNWVAYEKVTGKRVFKLGRTLFSVFFIHDLYYVIDKNNKQAASPFNWSPSTKAWIFISAGIIELMIALLGESNGWRGPTFSLMGLLVTRLVYFYSMYTAQLVINRSAGDPYGSANSKLTVSNQLFVILGFYLWFSYFSEIYRELTGQLPVQNGVVDQRQDSGAVAPNTPMPMR